MVVLLLVVYFLLTLRFSITTSLTQILENNFYALDLVCIGTNGGISVPSNREHHYRNLRDRYTNCTYVDGNLELTWLQDEDLDLSFLQYIREVTGYVLISHVDVQRVLLPNLQIIRGRTLYKLPVSDDSFGLLVMLSKMSTLELPSLRDILHGSVGLFNNYNLCHVRSINWTEAMSDLQAKYTYAYNFSQPQRTCHCDESCERGCWGEGSENCQKFSKITCSPQCHDGRCYGPGPRDCCHLFCAGGCSGPTQSECLACRNFNDNGTCKQECPPMNVYNTITYSWERNPHGKYAYGATCVRECPGHLLKDNGACVRSCPPGKKGVDGECSPCEGPCPKTCKGVKNVHSGNIDTFKDCTIIEGSLVILDHSFSGFQVVHDNFTFGEKYPKMHPSKLEVFSTLKEITGYISIQASHPEFTNLNFLRNLEIVGGRSTTEYFSSIYIVKTLLRSLNFQSLRLIRSGSVYILENKYLCFVKTINWNKLIDNHTKSQVLLENNRDEEQCEYEGMSCHKECSDNGCWSVGEDQCLTCRNKKLGNVCINSCNAPSIYKKNATECAYCHNQCKGGCSGPESKDCSRCKNVKDGPYCVENCPETKYSAGKSCKLCNENCVDGCKGPENNVGPNGCNSCSKALINREKGVEYCLQTDAPCPLGYFSDFVVKEEAGILRQMAGKNVCLRCHPRCKNCTGYGIHNTVCHQCFSYRLGENCVDDCPHDHYVDEIENQCLRCSVECSQGCYGPSESKCKSCRNYRIYTEGNPGVNNTNFYCTASCPDEFPYKIFPEDLSDPFCAASPNVIARVEDATIIGSVLGCLFIVCIIILLWGYCLWTKHKKKKAALKMTMSMIPYDDNEPLKPTNIRPNLAQLRIVKEAELRKGGILGYGAFGTVHKGVWIPEGENVKIPVAIKVLREGTETNINNKILEEAYIMASVDHPNLLRLLAVCMTTQTMMVTQLMPLGCLLDYVRNNKEKIGSKALLNWCTQIAKGMLYLEERRLVHRDLAARNVLVQTPNSVKITDFGLAKLLDFNEDEYKADGGKMPIKWLALECIQHRIFTHKSDVWAFGVTVWEILTYGGRPYDDFPAREVPERLEKGERLPQPPTCTIDIYMLMIKCWMLDYNSRPSFKELAEEFAKMSRDPGRFLVIPGDKLMRLPSYTPQDEKDMIRSLSSGFDGEGILMAAEEYLHPKNQPGTQISQSEPTTPVKTSLQFNSAFSSSDCASENSGSPQNRMNSQREKKFAQFDGRNPPPEDHQSARYFGGSMNPVGDSDVGDDDCFEPDGSRNHPSNYMGSNGPGYGWVGNVRLDLPLDEDDYLMPSQQPGLPTVGPSHQHYMELMADDAKQMRSGGYPVPNGSKGPHNFNEPNENITGHNIKRAPNHKKYPLIGYKFGPNGNMVGTNGQWTSMDNPEYHLFNSPHKIHAARPSISDDQNNIGVPVVQPSRSGRHSTSSSGSNSHHGNYGNISNPNGNHGGNLSNPNGNHGGNLSNPNGNHGGNISNPRGFVDDGSRKRPRISDSSHEYYNEVSNGENHSQPRSETTV